MPGTEGSDLYVALQLIGDRVPANSGGESYRNLARALTAIAADVSGLPPDDVQRSWVIKAAVRAVASPNGVLPHQLKETARRVVAAFSAMRDAPNNDAIRWPDGVPKEAQDALQKIHKQLELPGMDEIEISVPGHESVILENPPTRQKAKRSYEEHSAVEGFVDVIQVQDTEEAGGTYDFWMRTHPYGASVSCRYNPEQLDDVKAALGHHAAVEGLVRFRADGSVIRIVSVDRILRIPEPIADAADLRGVLHGMTGGLSGADYIDSMDEDDDA